MSDLIPMSVTDARVESVSLKFQENELKWQAEVVLLLQNGSRLTSIYVGNDQWDESKRAECSLELIELAKSIRLEVNELVTVFINRFNKRIDVKV